MLTTYFTNPSFLNHPQLCWQQIPPNPSLILVRENQHKLHESKRNTLAINYLQHKQHTAQNSTENGRKINSLDENASDHARQGTVPHPAAMPRTSTDFFQSLANHRFP
jgi:hypothetical protein